MSSVSRDSAAWAAAIEAVCQPPKLIELSPEAASQELGVRLSFRRNQYHNMFVEALNALRSDALPPLRAVSCFAALFTKDCNKFNKALLVDGVCAYAMRIDPQLGLTLLLAFVPATTDNTVLMFLLFSHVSYALLERDDAGSDALLSLRNELNNFLHSIYSTSYDLPQLGKKHFLLSEYRLRLAQTNYRQAFAVLQDYFESFANDDVAAKTMRDYWKVCVLADDVYAFEQVIRETSALPHYEEHKEDSYIVILLLLQSGELDMLKQYAQLLRNFEATPELHANADKVFAKAQVFALIKFICSEIQTTRHISYAQLCAKMQLDEIEVQRLLLKAFTAKLIAGHLDTLRKELLVTGIAPESINSTLLQSALGILKNMMHNVRAVRTQLAT